VKVPGVGRVDLLVEGHVILELDGYIWHGDEEAFERDHRRDLAAGLAHYRVLRFTYDQVMFEWPSVYAAVLAARQARPSTSRIHPSSNARSRQAA
jgi:very-short-patch-repair endonuclease